jgi:hypothetical protein
LGYMVLNVASSGETASVGICAWVAGEKPAIKSNRQKIRME